jgi:eukaryotic-like serine/threonine-protein kinase
MGHVRKLIRRRRDAPTGASGSASGGGRSTGRLPAELLTEQVQRLAVFSGVAGACWGFGLFMDVVVLPIFMQPAQRNWRAIALEIIATVAAAAMYPYLRKSPAQPEAKTRVGLAFMLLNAALIALLNAWANPVTELKDMHLSWVAILILVYSMIAPTHPRTMLYASLGAAAADPLAFAAASLLGQPTPPPVAVFVMVWPNFACALIAMLPSQVLQRIGRRLHEAQEMGSYQLLELLGTGGMGEVWRAQHRLLARTAAIKLVRPEVLGARTEADARLALRRFEREAQATAQLSSPHTIQLFDFGQTEEGTFYYVMELLIGRDLESLVREFGPVPANRAIYLLRQVCHSLADAHARGLVHRDIKPANIYVCRMGLEYDFVKVLDFGLVKFKERSRDPDTLMTLDHTTTGTPAYMAPETIIGDEAVDRRADVYALGCVAYFLLTGRLVFEGDTAMKVLMQHLHADPVPPSQRTEMPIPRELDDLVMACLQKDPARRPQDAGQLFQMACAARNCDGWEAPEARSWWEVHLPELSGPLTINEPVTRTDMAAV